MAEAPSKPGWQHLADFDLSRPEEALALVEHFQMEWYNGGFSQFFSNWNRADIVLIPDALRIVGALEAASVVEAAIAAVEPSASPIAARAPAPAAPIKKASSTGGAPASPSDNPLLGSIVEQFGKLRQQRAVERQAQNKQR